MTTYLDGNQLTAANLNDLQGYATDHGFNVVRDFDADPTGATSSTAAFQAAVDALDDLDMGGTVFAPAGTYLIGTPGIVWPSAAQKSITLAGVSMGSNSLSSRGTRLVRNGAHAVITAVGTGLTDGTIAHSPNVRDIEIDGAYAADAVVLTRVANAVWTRVTIRGSQRAGIRGKMLWNCYFTNCYLTGNGDAGTTTPSFVLTDDGAASTNTNTVILTGCQHEGNLWDDVYVDGPTAQAAGVQIQGNKFERTNGAAIRLADSVSTAVVGSYFYHDIASPSCIVVDNSTATNAAITGNVFAGSSGTVPTYMIELVTGEYVTVTANTFLGAGIHVRLQTGFGNATVLGNQSHLFNTPTIVSDQRTTKTGLIGSNGRIHAYDGIGVKTVAGAVSDGSFQQTPIDGTIALDTTNHRLYVRSGGTWRYATTT